MIELNKVECVVPVSGGKDSQACLKLAVESYGQSQVVGLFCDTQFEHPLTYRHVDKISDIYGVHIYRISAGSVEMQVRKNRRFPSGIARFCTEQLKIWPSKRFYHDFAMGNGPFEVWLGMRTGESTQRSKRYDYVVSTDTYPPHEVLSAYPKGLADAGVKFRLPIIDWTDAEVFAFLEGKENPLYSYGFSRVGCFPCLAAGDKHKERAFQFDETGAKHFAIARKLEQATGDSLFTSKGGKERNKMCDDFEGCAVCAI